MQFFRLLQTNYSLIDTLSLLTTNSIKLQGGYRQMFEKHMHLSMQVCPPSIQTMRGGGKHRDKMLYFLVTATQLGPPHHVLLCTFSLSLMFEDLRLFNPTRLRLPLGRPRLKQLLGESFLPCLTVTPFTPCAVL